MHIIVWYISSPFQLARTAFIQGQSMQSPLVQILCPLENPVMRDNSLCSLLSRERKALAASFQVGSSIFNTSASYTIDLCVVSTSCLLTALPTPLRAQTTRDAGPHPWLILTIKVLDQRYRRRDQCETWGCLFLARQSCVAMA